MGHSKLYAELHTWILGLSSATEMFYEDEPVCSFSRGDSIPQSWFLGIPVGYAKYLPSPPPPHFICSWAPLWSSSSFMVMVSSHLLTPTQTTYTDTQSKFLGLSTSWFSLSLPSTHSLGCGHHGQDCAILQGVDSSFPGNKAQGEQLGA